jgi:hypothetical protein
VEYDVLWSTEKQYWLRPSVFVNIAFQSVYKFVFAFVKLLCRFSFLTVVFVWHH